MEFVGSIIYKLTGPPIRQAGQPPFLSSKSVTCRGDLTHRQMTDCGVMCCVALRCVVLRCVVLFCVVLCCG